MRIIGIITKGGNLNDKVGSCFGKSNIIIVNWDNGIQSHDVVEVLKSKDCVGSVLAENLASNYRIEAVITGTIGCSAYGTFEKKGVDVYGTIKGNTVEEVAIAYFSNQLNLIEGSNSPGGSRCGGNHDGCGNKDGCGGCCSK
jgi:predicted Fe-Mo cluster-binding NifX family protein